MDFSEAREKLEKFVLENREYIQWNRIRKFAPSLYDGDEDSWLKGFVQACNPDGVLENCFGRGRLHYLAEENFDISLDSEVEYCRLIGAILDKLGFIAEISDPRIELEEFVIGNIACIRQDFFIQVASDLHANDDEDKLREYVRIKNPYDILENCFVAFEQQNLAVRVLGIDQNLNLQGRELVSAMLDKLGFKAEVKPRGLSQIREDLQSSLNLAEGSTQLSQDDVSGRCSGMARVLEGLLKTLFLFYSYTLLPDATEAAPTIQNLCKAYRKKQMKSLGDYLVFLKDLMDSVREDPTLVVYCRKNFQREVPLNQNHIAELRMFTVYRNLIIGHHTTGGSWEVNKKNAERRLKEMDSCTREKWEDSWGRVVDSELDFPRREMLRRMAVFFKEFLNSLDEGIYPKVIVMRTYTVDDYNTRRIAAVDDADETRFLTDCEFEPFVEFYYHSRTNPEGIDRSLCQKRN